MRSTLAHNPNAKLEHAPVITSTRVTFDAFCLTFCSEDLTIGASEEMAGPYVPRV